MNTENIKIDFGDSSNEQILEAFYKIMNHIKYLTEKIIDEEEEKNE